MAQQYAKEFSEIPQVLASNDDLREAILNLIDSQPVAGKVTEGGTRLNDFKEVLKRLVRGELSLFEAERETIKAIPQRSSPHGANNRVFPSGWAERLIRTQYSRFYNQAVLEELISQEKTECYIEHSSEEDRNSKCSQYLAGRAHDPHLLHQRLVNAYANGNWSNDLKVPDHPHCSHTVSPVE